MENILIYSHGRSGSRTLTRSLNLHPGIDLVSKPFNSTRHNEPGYRMDYEHDLERQLSIILGRYNGLKHVWDRSGWPFPEGTDLSKHLLSNPRFKVLFLHRKNLLQRLVSIHLSRHSDV